MADEREFADLIHRVRAGDESAAVELVGQYEAAIRRRIRLRIRDSRLRRLVDSVDICQSVMASFFMRAASGQYDLQKPEQLLALLTTMARNKLATQTRKRDVQRRDNPPGNQDELFTNLAAQGDTPSQLVAGRDLLEAVRKQMSPPERQLAELRSQGKEWAEIAAEVGGTAEALRKTLARALDRIAHDLGLDDLNRE